MIIKNITNPIFFELLKLKILNKKKIIKLSATTRDKKITVFQDTKSKVIFLGKCPTNSQYYKSIKYNDDKYYKSIKYNDDNIISKKKKNGLVQTLKDNIISPILEDDRRRAIQHAEVLRNKKILDFGCGWGGFLKKTIKAKSLSGIELRKECISYIKKNIKKIQISDNLNNFKVKYDVITMFHVLEHIPHQIKILKELKKKLTKNGKIIIEVPSAEDFLFKLKEFKKFSFWSEHLILHTENSLRKILEVSGFKKIKISYYQRYNFSNHLGWFMERKPGGHNSYKTISDNRIDKEYSDYLIRKKNTDTLIATAKN